MQNNICGKKTLVYSRIVGFHNPVQNWNKGKREEFRKRRPFLIKRQIVTNSSPIRVKTERKNLSLANVYPRLANIPSGN